MNLTLSKEGRKMGFKEFVKVFGKHFKSLPEAKQQQAMQSEYTRLTGKKATSGNADKVNKSNKKV